MDEKTPNKKSSKKKVRIPDEIILDLNRLEAEALAAGNPRPVYGDLLLAAWRSLHPQRGTGIGDFPQGGPGPQGFTPEKYVSNRPGQVLEWRLETGTTPPVTPQEDALLAKTLRVLRSAAGQALSSNIDQFDTLREFYERFGVSSASSGAENRTGTDDAAIDRALTRAQRAVALVERLGRDAEGTKRGKDRPHRPARKRGGA